MKSSHPILLTGLAFGLFAAVPAVASACEDDVKVSTKVIRLGDKDQSTIRVLTSDMLGDKAVKVLTGLCSDADGEPCIIRIGGGDDGPIAILLHGGSMNDAGHRVSVANGFRIGVAGDEDEGGTWLTARNAEGKKIFKSKAGEGDDFVIGERLSGGWFSDGDHMTMLRKAGDGGEDHVIIFEGEDGNTFELKTDNKFQWRSKDKSDGADSKDRFIRKMVGDGQNVFVFDSDDEDDDRKKIIKKRVIRKGNDGNGFSFKGGKLHDMIKGGEVRVQVEIPGITGNSEDVIRRAFELPNGQGEIKVVIEGLGDVDDMKHNLKGMLHDHLTHLMDDIDIDIDSDDLQKHLHKALQGAMKGQHGDHFEMDFEGFDGGNIKDQIESQLRMHLGGDDEDDDFEIRFDGNSEEMKKRIEKMIRERVGDKADAHAFEIHVDVEAEDEDGNPQRQRQVWFSRPDGDDDHHEYDDDDDDHDESLARRLNRLEDRLDRLSEMLEELMDRMDR